MNYTYIHIYILFGEYFNDGLAGSRIQAYFLYGVAPEAESFTRDRRLESSAIVREQRALPLKPGRNLQLNPSSVIKN